MPSPVNPQTLNRYAYTLNNPLKHTDPTGHSAKAAGGDKPWWVPDAFGIRVELSVAPLSFVGDALTAATSETVVGAAAIWVATHIAVDVNYDMVFSLYDQETGELGFPRLSEIQDRIDVFQTKGGQFATEGGGVSIGGLALYNVKNNDVLEGMQFEIAGTTKTPIGLEVGAFTDLSQSSLPLCFYGGVGFGAEVTPLSATIGKSENITDRFWNFLDRLSNAYQRLSDQPQ